MEEVMKELESLKEQLKGLHPEFNSREMDKLFSALSKAQNDIETAELNNKNPFYKSRYADLASIVKASRPALAENGLCVIQQILPGKDGQMYLHTKLGHTSGQWVESRNRS